MGFGETNNSLSSRQRGEELERGTWFQIVDGGFGRTELTTDLDGGGSVDGEVHGLASGWMRMHMFIGRYLLTVLGWSIGASP